MHFGAAARALRTAQPSLSVQIRRLETELGVTLLERDRHQVALTPAGYAFLAEARSIVARAERSIAIARDVADGRGGRLRIACGGIFEERMSVALRSYARDLPDVAIEATVVSDATALLLIDAEQTDVALVGELTAGEAGRHALTPLGTVLHPLMAAFQEDHPLRAVPLVDVDLLHDFRFLIIAESAYPALHRTIRETVAAGGSGFPHLRDVEEPAALVGLVAAGLGITLMPRAWSRLMTEHLRIAPLRNDVPVRTVAYRRNDTPNVAADAFAPYLAAAFAQ